MNFQIIWLPLFLGTIIHLFLGSLWFSPLLFGKIWAKEAALTEQHLQKSQEQLGFIYVWNLIFSLLTVYFIGFIMQNLKLTHPKDIIFYLTFIWLSINLPVAIRSWGFEGRSLKLGLINHVYDLLAYLSIAYIYTFFL